MKRAEKLILTVGVLGLGVLLWRMDASAVLALVAQVRWGLLLIVAQEIVAHVFNAVGWRLAFPPDKAASFGLWELIRLRIAGDAVNYVTPSATIAGELARTEMLNDSEGAEVRASSVLVAKFTQALAQAAFSIGGLAAFAAQLSMLRGKEWYAYGAGLAFLAALLILGVYEAQRKAPDRAPDSRDFSWKDLRAMRGWLRYHYRRHPARFAGSSLFFALGYAWGAFEAYWICYFIGLRVTAAVALMIEVLSLTIDGVLFMVPAKVGTQEGGKTAIFAALGMAPTAGFAFGIVRHIRELAWSALGLALCSFHRADPPAPSATPDRSEAVRSSGAL
ncbi:MAG: flippase-like domain-containing protein [Elusimicrobia bacterium]|nr:flippase-like domain-containing protein [Elusimicrobiota bacterium]